MNFILNGFLAAFWTPVRETCFSLHRRWLQALLARWAG